MPFCLSPTALSTGSHTRKEHLEDFSILLNFRFRGAQAVNYRKGVEQLETSAPLLCVVDDLTIKCQEAKLGSSMIPLQRLQALLILY